MGVSVFMADLEINKTSFANNRGRWHKDCLSSLFPASPSMQRELDCLMNWPQADTVQHNKKIHLTLCRWSAGGHLSHSTSLEKVLEWMSNEVWFPTEMWWHEGKSQWEAVNNRGSGTWPPCAAQATGETSLPPAVWKWLNNREKEENLLENLRTKLSWAMDCQMT